MNTTHPAITQRSQRCAMALCESPEGMRREGPRGRLASPEYAIQTAAGQVYICVGLLSYGQNLACPIARRPMYQIPRIQADVVRTRPRPKPSGPVCGTGFRSGLARRPRLQFMRSRENAKCALRPWPRRRLRVVFLRRKPAGSRGYADAWHCECQGPCCAFCTDPLSIHCKLSIIVEMPLSGVRLHGYLAQAGLG